MVGRVAVGFVLTLAAAAAGVVLPGNLETYGPPGRQLSAREVREGPRWAPVCRSREYADARPLIHACGRVQGRVVYVQRWDPGGDGEAKLLVGTRDGFVIVKIAVHDRPRELPGVLERVTAVGPMIDGPVGTRSVFAWMLRRG